jgi:type II secretory pathway component PulK
VNTASETVLAALLPTKPDKIADIVRMRRVKPFRSDADIAAVVGAESVSAFDVKSAYFAVQVRVAQDDVQLATEALVKRVAPSSGASTPTAIIWRRHRY